LHADIHARRDDRPIIAYMSFDTIVANPGRLRILTALAVEETQEFVHLRRATNLTDGNLSSHARRLQSAGLVEIDKSFKGGKPVTSFTLTQQGRAALEAHVRKLMAALSHKRIPSEEPAGSSETREPQPSEQQPAAVASTIRQPDDWVD
jgi:DNA-binding MarR family transcriptional regulator